MITIQPTSGLCNYLRVIFSYYEYAKSIHSHLNVIWNVTDACNGFFLDYFEPIDGITFYEKKPPNIGKIYYRGCSVKEHYTPNYEKLKLISIIKDKVDNKLDILGRNNYISVHVRRTDHTELAQKNNCYTSEEQFKAFIEKHNSLNIFIATDNITTYNTFKQLYNNRIKLNFNNTFPDNLRKTTLEDAIIDIYLCVYSTEFMGSGWSSFSEIIKHLRQLTRKHPNKEQEQNKNVI